MIFLIDLDYNDIQKVELSILIWVEVKFSFYSNRCCGESEVVVQKFDKATKQYKIQCKHNPFTTSFVKGTRSTDVQCESKWKKIELQQLGVPVPKHKFNMAKISEDSKSLFIKYSPEWLAASKDGTQNIQAPLKTENVDDPELYCVSGFFSH